MVDAGVNDNPIINPKLDIIKYKMLDKAPFNVIIEADENINLIKFSSLMKKMKIDIENVVSLKRNKAKIIAKSAAY